MLPSWLLPLSVSCGNKPAQTSDAEYETLYLFMFGCQYEEGEVRQEKIEKLKSEVNFKLKLEKAHDKSTFYIMRSMLLKSNKFHTKKQIVISINFHPLMQI